MYYDIERVRCAAPCGAIQIPAPTRAGAAHTAQAGAGETESKKQRWRRHRHRRDQAVYQIGSLFIR